MTNTIRLERARLGITQAVLAEKVNVARQTINSIEGGKFIPSTTLAFKIATVLNCPIQNLFVLEDDDWDDE
jgi:putative transcriptional regulator